MRAVVVERQRIDDAAAGEGEAGLAGEEREVLRLAQAQRVRRRRSACRRRAGRGRRRRSPGRRRCGLRGVSTSTIGSSQNRPREPVRTIVRRSPRPAADATPTATASAPSASAAASRGMKTRVMARRSSSASIRAGVEPAQRRAVQHRRRGRWRTGPGRTPAPASPRRPRWCRASRRPGAGAHARPARRRRATGRPRRGRAAARAGPAGAAEVVIEADDPMHLGAGQVQRLGDHRHRLGAGRSRTPPARRAGSAAPHRPGRHGRR